ncbi:MAG: LuxR family transcriptional regulator [Roseibium album]|uniref:Regulatory protein SdiA n=1 Tax=Roseibium album TaxID=311410 RepID=A0A0M6ZL72_9HYPH|nr:LuxR family transcriptional regulator [Roseibium album]MCR9057183.1 LuxR family transcriptional regulator [Paracoccaceae bacterium]CTQ62886.1 Regulatory protein SdiA [Roseibium album]CTQ68983.1 Regulatory protein SdiA [Roseibium album]CTQ80470.1 Regulatory protein SdiA [Roseibium album]
MTEATHSQLESVVDFYSSINELQTPSELYRKLKLIAQEFQFDHYVALNVPQVTEKFIRPSFIASNWPRSLVAQYDRLGLLENSPIIDGLRRKHTPIVVDLEEGGVQRPMDEQSATISLFLEHKMPRHFYVPCHDKTGRRGAIGFSGTRSLPSPSEGALLHMMGLYAFSRLYALISELGDKTVLSAREMECLVWSARGKTSAECAVILGVAESTVAGYLASLSRKLHAQNKAQMIAIAYELGLISHANINLR